jgi:hypothetical protein
MQRQQLGVEREHIALVNPNQLPHSARTCRVLR